MSADSSVRLGKLSAYASNHTQNMNSRYPTGEGVSLCGLPMELLVLIMEFLALHPGPHLNISLVSSILTYASVQTPGLFDTLGLGFCKPVLNDNLEIKSQSPNQYHPYISGKEMKNHFWTGSLRKELAEVNLDQASEKWNTNKGQEICKSAFERQRYKLYDSFKLKKRVVQNTMDIAEALASIFSLSKADWERLSPNDPRHISRRLLGVTRLRICVVDIVAQSPHIVTIINHLGKHLEHLELEPLVCYIKYGATSGLCRKALAQNTNEKHNDVLAAWKSVCDALQIQLAKNGEQVKLTSLKLWIGLIPDSSARVAFNNAVMKGLRKLELTGELRSNLPFDRSTLENLSLLIFSGTQPPNFHQRLLNWAAGWPQADIAIKINIISSSDDSSNKDELIRCKKDWLSTARFERTQRAEAMNFPFEERSRVVGGVLEHEGRYRCIDTRHMHLIHSDVLERHRRHRIEVKGSATSQV